MATIGTFTCNEDGIFQGSAKTLSLNTKVRFVSSSTTESEKAPDLRAYAGSGIEFGAAWTKRTKDQAHLPLGQARQSQLSGSDTRQPRRGLRARHLYPGLEPLTDM